MRRLYCCWIFHLFSFPDAAHSVRDGSTHTLTPIVVSNKKLMHRSCSHYSTRAVYGWYLIVCRVALTTTKRNCQTRYVSGLRCARAHSSDERRSNASTCPILRRFTCTMRTHQRPTVRFIAINFLDLPLCEWNQTKDTICSAMSHCMAFIFFDISEWKVIIIAFFANQSIFLFVECTAVWMHILHRLRAPSVAISSTQANWRWFAEEEESAWPVDDVITNIIKWK